mgnify:CR=1 FL=1
MTELENIPKGWTIAKFEDLLDYIQPTNYIVKSTDYKDTYPTPVLTAGKSFIKGYTNETEGIFSKLPTIIFDDFTTATQFVNFPFKVKSSAMKILQPTCDLVNIKLAYYYMQTIHLKGETHKRFWISEYSQIPVPLAPLNEQKRILAKLEQLLTDLYKGIEYLETTKQQLKVYRQAVLKWAFEGKLTRQHHGLSRLKDDTDNKTTKKKISEIKKSVQISDSDKGELAEGKFNSFINLQKITTKIGSGATPKGGESNYKKSGIPLIRSMNIHFNYIEYKGLAYIDETQSKELDNVIVKENDVLLNITGASIGRVNIAPNNLAGARVNQHVSIIRLTENYYSKFVKYFLQSPSVQSWITKENYGVTRQALTKGMIEQMKIPNISLNEQYHIVSEIESRLSVCDKIEESIESSLQQAEALRLSIIKKAFEGKLVPQDPDDEPAEKLLQQLRIENYELRKKKK